MNIFHIKSKKSNKRYNVTTNSLIKIPEKITMKLPKNDANSTIDSINVNLNVNADNSTVIVQQKSIYNRLLEFLSNYKELLYLFRPVIYMASLICFKKNKFVPLLINLTIDFVVLRNNNFTGKFSKQKIFHSENLYRVRQMVFYLLREPIFSSITLPFVKKLLSFLRFPDRLVGLIINFLEYFSKLYYIL